MNYPVQDHHYRELLLAAEPENVVDVRAGSNPLPSKETRSCGDVRHFSGFMSVFLQEWMKRLSEEN